MNNLTVWSFILVCVGFGLVLEVLDLGEVSSLSLATVGSLIVPASFLLVRRLLKQGLTNKAILILVGDFVLIIAITPYLDSYRRYLADIGVRGYKAFAAMYVISFSFQLIIPLVIVALWLGKIGIR